MGLTRKQRILLGVVGLGAVALVVDRAILLPASASADGLITTPAAQDEQPSTAEQSADSAAGLDMRDIANRLGRVAERVGVDRAELTLNTFEGFPPQTQPGLEQPTPDGEATGTSELPTFVLSSVLPAATRRLAVINGTTVVVGGEIPGTGWKLLSVGEAHAVVTDGAQTHRIRLPRPH